MKKIIFMLLMALFCIFPITAMAEYYKVTVTKKSKDLYKIEYTGSYVVTKWCYYYAAYDEAILKYEPYSYDNKLVFSSGETCDVEKVIK